MRKIETKEVKKEITLISEDIRVPGTDIILEKGDRVIIIDENFSKKDKVVSLETLYTPYGDIPAYSKGTVIEYDKRDDIAIVEFNDIVEDLELEIKDASSKLQKSS